METVDDVGALGKGSGKFECPHIADKGEKFK
jgi:hypothetical protein